jgi:hypothetical protein
MSKATEEGREMALAIVVVRAKSLMTMAVMAAVAIMAAEVIPAAATAMEKVEVRAAGMVMVTSMAVILAAAGSCCHGADGLMVAMLSSCTRLMLLMSGATTMVILPPPDPPSTKAVRQEGHQLQQWCMAHGWVLVALSSSRAANDRQRLF